MRFCKKVSAFFALFLTLFLGATYAFAASSITIKSADLVLFDEAYSLNAETDIIFDADIDEAINKGVPLNFLFEFQVVTPHKYWFDDEIVTKSMNVTLRYHALSRQYLVSRGGRQTSYETLSEAREELMQLQDWKVLDKALLEKDKTYKAALLVRLDQSKLPPALQVEAIGSNDWNLSSQKFEWTPKELNK